MSWSKEQQKRAEVAEARVAELEALVVSLEQQIVALTSQNSDNIAPSEAPKRRGRPRVTKD